MKNKLQKEVFQVYQIGTKVMLQSSIEVTVTGIIIRANGFIQYEVSWADGMSHTCKWVDAVEVSGRTRKSSVGFSSAPSLDMGVQTICGI